MTTSSAFIPVLDIADELGADVPDAHREEAARRARLLALQLEAGELPRPFVVEELPEVRGRVSGLLIAQGMLLSHVSLARRTATQLLGPGDIFPAAAHERLLPYVRHFEVVDSATIAVLDDRFRAVAQRWPWIASRLLESSTDQHERSAVQQAISQLSRVELRILAFMWHAGERWGRVTASGLSLHLPLTHTALGHLVGAKRPTVSLALKSLDAENVLTRRSSGDWLVHPNSSDLLAEGGAALRLPKATVRASVAPGAGHGVDVVSLVARIERLQDEQTANAERTAELMAQVSATRERRAGPREDTEAAG